MLNKPTSKVFAADMQGNQAWKYAHCKRDGHFLRISAPMDRLAGDIIVETSNPTDITHTLRWHSTIQEAAVCMPPGAVVLCECWAAGVQATSIKTLINDQDERLRIDAFAIQCWPDLKHEALTNLTLLQTSHRAAKAGFPFITYKDITEDQAIASLLKDRQFDPCLEGYVLKNGNLLDWCKLKPEKTIDLIFRGITNAKPGKYQGQVGAITCCTAEGFNVADCSGMTDAVRMDLTGNWRHLLGSVVEVEYQGVGSRGKLRHPRFVRFRDDKEPAACTVNQDVDLENIWIKNKG